jgi:hypothetical protein
MDVLLFYFLLLVCLIHKVLRTVTDFPETCLLKSASSVDSSFIRPEAPLMGTAPHTFQ